MKGQLSLELMLVILILVTAFAVLIPNIQSTAEAGNYLLDTQNKQIILEKLAAACKRAHITAPYSTETIEIYSLTNYTIQTIGKEFDVSCVADNIMIKEGYTQLQITYESGSARISNPDS